MARVAAIDVGLRTMAHCVLSWPGDVPRAAAGLNRARAALAGSAAVVDWGVESLIAANRKARAHSLSEQLDLVAAYVRRHAALFATCQHVVIEQQPAARMRNLAVALYCCLRREAPDAVVIFQPAAKKLDWGPALFELLPGTSWGTLRTYAGRKKAAVLLTWALLREEGEARFVDARGAFAATRKRDDLADCFLHALARGCQLRVPAGEGAAATAVSRKRLRGKTSAASLGLVVVRGENEADEVVGAAAEGVLEQEWQAGPEAQRDGAALHGANEVEEVLR
jgi:hypothetical protein